MDKPGTGHWVGQRGKPVQEGEASERRQSAARQEQNKKGEQPHKRRVWRRRWYLGVFTPRAKGFSSRCQASRSAAISGQDGPRTSPIEYSGPRNELHWDGRQRREGKGQFKRSSMFLPIRRLCTRTSASPMEAAVPLSGTRGLGACRRRGTANGPPRWLPAPPGSVNPLQPKMSSSSRHGLSSLRAFLSGIIRCRQSSPSVWLRILEMVTLDLHTSSAA